MRARKPMPPVGVTSRHDLSAGLPTGMRLAGAWAWRLLAIAAVLAVLSLIVSELRLLVVPLLVAVVLSALLIPFKNTLIRYRWPAWLAVTTALASMILVVTILVIIVITQFSKGIAGLAEPAARTFNEFGELLQSLPLNLTASDVEVALSHLWGVIQDNSASILSGIGRVGSSIGQLLVGIGIALFATLFILIDGPRIWAWIVQLFPRAARSPLDDAGRAGWTTLTGYARVQIFVATIDGVGIGLGAAFLGVPMALPIAVIVFLGSFIPFIGAIVAGAIAVLIAFLSNGWVTALVLLGIVLLVQQVESHVLQPLIMGHAIGIHPLGVVIAVTAGSMLAGISGALFAVPIVATLNSAVRRLANRDRNHNPALAAGESHRAPS